MAGNVFDNFGEIPSALLEQGEVAETEVQDQTPPAEAETEEGQGEPQNETETEVPTQEEWQKEFKNPAELYEAYRKTQTSYENLRPKFTQTAQELSALKKGRGMDNQQQADPVKPPLADAKPQTPAAKADDPVAIVMNYINEAVQKAVQPVHEQNEDLMMQNAVARMAYEKKDFAEVSPVMKEVLQNDPSLWKTSNPLEHAYKIAKASMIEKNLEKIVTEAKREAYADKQVKVLGGDKPRPSSVIPTEKTQEELIKDSILAESRFAKGRGIF